MGVKVTNNEYTCDACGEKKESHNLPFNWREGFVSFAKTWVENFIICEKCSPYGKGEFNKQQDVVKSTTLTFVKKFFKRTK